MHRGPVSSNISLKSSPRDIIKVLTEDNPGVTSVAFGDILPSQARLDDELKALRSDPAHPSLAINHPLVPPSSMFDPAKDPDALQTSMGSHRMQELSALFFPSSLKIAMQRRRAYGPCAIYSFFRSTLMS